MDSEIRLRKCDPSADIHTSTKETSNKQVQEQIQPCQDISAKSCRTESSDGKPETNRKTCGLNNSPKQSEDVIHSSGSINDNGSSSEEIRKGEIGFSQTYQPGRIQNLEVLPPPPPPIKKLAPSG